MIGEGGANFGSLIGAGEPSVCTAALAPVGHMFESFCSITTPFGMVQRTCAIAFCVTVMTATMVIKRMCICLKVVVQWVCVG